MRPDLITNQSAADGIARLLGDARRSAEWRPGSVGPAAVEGEPVRRPKMIISFTVPAIPVAQPRQRHRVIQSAGKTYAMNYTPKRDPVNEFKATVRMAWQSAFRALGDGVFYWGNDTPMRLHVVAIFPRPKSKTRKRGDNPRLLKTSKPDWDNVGKSVSDALSGLAWNDDSQVVDARVVKWVAAADEQPHVDVTIEAMEG
jgi:Holliday junction resolvase RusA-like endonuclease